MLIFFYFLIFFYIGLRKLQKLIEKWNVKFEKYQNKCMKLQDEAKRKSKSKFSQKNTLLPRENNRKMEFE
jgi:hypothetical protein